MLNSCFGIIDKTDNLVVKYTYDAYGKCLSITGSNIGYLNPFRYKGYYFDSESGMYYCKSRYYVPEWGRWLNCDSINFLEPGNLYGLNLYAYCGNAPINRIDSNGHFWFTFITTIVGAVVGATVSVVNALIAQENISWKTIVGGAINGAVTGLILGLTRGTGIALASYASATSESVFREVCGYVTGEKKIDKGNVLKSFASICLDTAINGTVNYICNKTASKIPSIKTIRSWFIPKSVGSYLFGSYGQRLMAQSIVGGAENVYINALLIPLKHYANELIDFWIFDDPIESL